MIKSPTNGTYIDLNKVGPNTEIAFNSLFTAPGDSKQTKEPNFQYEEVQVNDSSGSIYFNQHQNKLLISVYGPRETRYREKAKTEEAIVEVYTKFNYEINKEKLKSINGIIQNFCESLIFLDAYPRCQVNICINVLTFKDENLLMSTILNGIMFCLSISGIDLKTFALTTSFYQDDANLLISLDANKPDNILLIETSKPLKYEVYKNYIEKAKEETVELYKHFKKVLYKKLK